MKLRWKWRLWIINQSLSQTTTTSHIWCTWPVRTGPFTSNIIKFSLCRIFSAISQLLLFLSNHLLPPLKSLIPDIIFFLRLVSFLSSSSPTKKDSELLSPNKVHRLIFLSGTISSSDIRRLKHRQLISTRCDLRDRCQAYSCLWASKSTRTHTCHQLWSYPWHWCSRSSRQELILCISLMWHILRRINNHLYVETLRSSSRNLLKMKPLLFHNSRKK